MHYIQTLELATQTSLPQAVNIVRSHGFLTLAQQATAGHLLTYPLCPRLAHRWEGFGIYPDEAGVSIALRNPDTQQEYQFSNGNWVPSTSPVYQSSEQLRDRLAAWAGPIQFRLQLERVQGAAPLVYGLKIGFHIARDLLSDLLHLALPSMLQIPIELSRETMPSASRLSVEKPSGLNLQQLSDPKIMVVPGQQTYPATINQNTIAVSTPLPPGGTHLIFKYLPRIEAIEPEDSYQITNIPVVILRFVERQDTRTYPMQDWVRVSLQQCLLWRATHSYSAVVELTVIAQTDAEARAIANQLQGHIRSKGFIEAPQYGSLFPILVNRGITPGAGDLNSDLYRGGLESVTFSLKLLSVIEGEWVEKSPLLVGIDPVNVQSID